MFKVNNKNTRTTSVTYFAPFLMSLLLTEQVNAGWVSSVLWPINLLFWELTWLGLLIPKSYTCIAVNFTYHDKLINRWPNHFFHEILHRMSSVCWDFFWITNYIFSLWCSVLIVMTVLWCFSFCFLNIYTN